MKYNKYLIISTLTLIILVTTLFYTKNIFYLYLTIPICIYVSFIKFYQEKDKLLVKTNVKVKLLRKINSKKSNYDEKLKKVFSSAKI